MHVSFDLDGTLIPLAAEFACERRGWWARRRGVEAVRRGTVSLLRGLQADGHAVSVYTTSTRSVGGIRRTFRHYGIALAQVITYRRNRATLTRVGVTASKFPPAFGFDLHVDDLPGVAIEGERLGFETLIIGPEDEQWVVEILARVVAMSSTGA